MEHFTLQCNELSDIFIVQWKMVLYNYHLASKCKKMNKERKAEVWPDEANEPNRLFYTSDLTNNTSSWIMRSIINKGHLFSPSSYVFYLPSFDNDGDLVYITYYILFRISSLFPRHCIFLVLMPKYNITGCKSCYL